MKIKQTVDYEKIVGLPEYNKKEKALLKSVDALSSFTVKSLQEIRKELSLEKKVIDDGEIEKYDRL